MIHESSYDQAASDCADEDRRQARQEEAEEFANEVRQLGGMGAYWASLDETRSPPDDLTTNETRGE